MSLNSQPEPRASRVLAEGDEGSVPRRAMLQGLATAIAGVVLPASGDVAAQAPVASAALPPPAGPASLPQFLSPHEQETLARIGDQLMPGSGSVGVAAMADRLLSVESAEVQRRFRNALGAFEHEARVRHAKTWIELSPAEQAAILDEAAKTPSARSEPPVWTRGQPVRSPEPNDSPPASMRDHLVDLRDFVARIYFSSEAGMRELGWEGNVFWESLPGCDARG